jgi:leader peptidase (prepilin peptidase)/N-methyltransferase
VWGGRGFGDVKLAVLAGAWLSLGTIPLRFGLAAGAALVTVTVGRLDGGTTTESTGIEFCAFLCPALWLVFYVSVLPTRVES